MSACSPTSDGVARTSRCSGTWAFAERDILYSRRKSGRTTNRNWIMFKINCIKFMTHSIKSLTKISSLHNKNTTYTISFVFFHTRLEHHTRLCHYNNFIIRLIYLSIQLIYWLYVLWGNLIHSLLSQKWAQRIYN